MADPEGVVDVRVRLMRWRDIEHVLPIEQAEFGVEAWPAETFWSELAGFTGRAHYLVAEVASAGSEQSGLLAPIVAYAGGCQLGTDVEVRTVCVAANYRRHAIASQLLGALTQSAIEAQASRMLLEVRADNPGAIAFYRRQGFEVLDRRPGYYRPQVDALVMARSIDQDSAGALPDDVTASPRTRATDRKEGMQQ